MKGSILVKQKTCMSIRSIEHQGDSIIGKRESLGAKEHMQYYHGQFD